MGSVPEKVDPALKAWATPRQAEYIDAINEHGGITAAARALGTARQVIQRAIWTVKLHHLQAQRQEAIAPHTTDGFAVREVTKAYDGDGEVTGEWVREGPEPPDYGGLEGGPERDGHDGWHIWGVSTLYGAAGEVRAQWVKTRKDTEDRAAAIRKFVAWLDERGIEGRSPLIAAPALVNADLLNVLPIGDPHFGMRAYAKEAGANFDLAVARSITTSAIDHLVSAAPAAETALIILMGDNFHTDHSDKAVTPGHENPVDMAGRQAEIIEVGQEAFIWAIERALEKHNHVIVWVNRGNHDPMAALWLAWVLRSYFRNNGRVTVDVSPGLYKYLRFGKVLIGSHHGHGAKPEDLALIMATDCAEDWGQSSKRYIYVGHFHHKWRSGQGVPGAEIEGFETLAPADAYHSGKGYRSGRSMPCITHHREHGEVGRIKFDASMWMPAA